MTGEQASTREPGETPSGSRAVPVAATDVVELVRRPRRVRIAALLLLVAAVIVAAVASVMIGSRGVSSFSDLAAVLGGDVNGVAEGALAKRLPRTVMALIIGAALGLAGAVMQGVTRNPLADPGILGVNTGAALAIAIGVAFFSLEAFASKIWVALVGAAITAVLVYVMGSLGRGGATPLKLALAGSATAAALMSLTSAVVLPRGNIAEGIQAWNIGGVGGATLPALAQGAPYLVAGVVLCLLSAPGLNALALGDDLAAGLGAHVGLSRAVAALGAVLLAACATALCGPIGFVGLVVPHAVRMLSGPDHTWLLPFSALGGAVLLAVSDLVGRVLLPPSEIAVGIITAVVGAPFFVSIVRRQKVREL
ncbi:MAG: FecCD family ABC transporter permease [Galactobacter sp.]